MPKYSGHCHGDLTVMNILIEYFEDKYNDHVKPDFENSENDHME